MAPAIRQGRQAVTNGCIPINIALLCVVFVPCGCSRSDGRLKITGTVTVDGQPLKSAAISFQPVDKAKSHGSGGVVEGGTFRIPADQGLTPGDYFVQMLVPEETGRTIVRADRGEVPETRLAEFRENGTLRITVREGGENHFELKLTRVKR